MLILIYNFIVFLFYPVVITQRGARPVSAPVFSQAALAEAGIPMAPLDQLQTSTPIRTLYKTERKLEVTVEAVEPSKSEAVDEVKVFSLSLYNMFMSFVILKRSLKIYMNGKCSVILDIHDSCVCIADN